MPYINDHLRPSYDREINELVSKLDVNTPGDINYVISRIVWALFRTTNRYGAANSLLGVLEAVKLEFYRRCVAPYEDIVKERNGDLT